MVKVQWKQTAGAQPENKGGAARGSASESDSSQALSSYSSPSELGGEEGKSDSESTEQQHS